MKDKVTYLVLGILIGAIITAGCFMLFSKKDARNMPKGNMENRIREDRLDDLKEPSGVSSIDNSI